MPIKKLTSLKILMRVNHCNLQRQLVVLKHAIYTAMKYMFPRPTQLSTPNCILISSAIFTQLMAGSPYTLQRALKHD